MSKKLSVWLPDTWRNISHENPEGPFTVRWNAPKATGVLQVSVAEYSGGAEPRPTKSDLQDLATGFGRSRNLGDPVTLSSGSCVFGAYGTASFIPAGAPAKGEPAYSQVWFLSNGLDFMMITFVAMSLPEAHELHDAQRIVEGINLK